MKFWGIVRFELRYQLRRPWPWVFALVLLVLSFLVARDASLADALYEDFFANSPFAVAKTTVFGGLVWLLIAAAVAGEAAARDVSTRMHPLVYTAPVHRAEYLGGRFVAALLLNAAILLAPQAGILLGIYSPGVDPAVLGPFRPAAFFASYAFIALPNAFAATSLQFLLATRTGRPMAAYLGSFALFFMAFFVASLLLFRRGLGTLLDPIGVRFVWEDLSHQWTTIEKSRRMLALQGDLLGNRLLWLAAGAAALAVTYLTFRFAHRAETAWRLPWTGRRRMRSSLADTSKADSTTPIVVPDVRRSFDFAAQWRKTAAITWTSFRTLALSWPGLALLLGVPLMSVLIVIDQMSSLGTPLTPTTARVLGELTAPLSAQLSRWVIVPPLIVFFAGELIWRERDAGLGELTDAMPGSDWAPLLGKFAGLSLVIVLFLTLLMGAGITAQTVLGYRDYEIGLYAKVLLGLQLAEYLLFALFAVAVHVVVDQKYAGHLVAMMVYVFIVALARMLGIEHNLLVYGAGPGWSYTPMRGFGSSIAPWLWFKLYWAGWGVMLAVAARLMWARGREVGWRVRLGLARRRLTGSTLGVAAGAGLFVVATGGFVFYNTNILNEYRDADSIGDLRAEYERRYRRYEAVPQPQMSGSALRVELYPERGVVDIGGTYRLVNLSGASIDSIHVSTSTGRVETRGVGFDRPATLVLDDREHGYRIYDLETPLRPGDSLGLHFQVHVERRGFTNNGIDPSLAGGGSYFTSQSWFPFVGYQRFREVLSPADRRERGLPARPILASLYENEGREPTARGGGVMFSAVIGTTAGQTAVAPGALRRTWSEKGRSYFEYATDAPIGSEWAFLSARYTVHESRWNDVVIRNYHDPKHTAHVDRMMRAARSSLAYYSEQFGPYPYGHLSLVENPGAPGTGAHADASMITYGQGFAQWIPKPGQRGLDFPFAVVAHEMAHEWTLPYALVEGLPFLSEGLAWYGAMQVVRDSGGPDQLRKLLAFMRQPFPFRPIRRGETLLRALDPYLSYRRGPFAMYALSEYVGKDRVNGALKKLVATHDAPGAPQATTLDLYRELKAVTPDSLRPLLRDLFELNTLWDLQTERVTAEQTASGTWRVTLDVKARKTRYDSAGVVTEVPMDEWIPVGVFAPAEGSDELSAPLYLQRQRIRSGRQTITLFVSRKPALAGIDPFHVLDWEERENDDNIEPASVGGRTP